MSGKRFRNGLAGVAALAACFALGWWTATHLQTSGNPVESHSAESSYPYQAESARVVTADPFEQAAFLRWLHSDQIEDVVRFWQEPARDARQQLWMRQQIHQHLGQLKQAQQWALLSSWVDALLPLEPDNERYQDLAVELALARDDTYIAVQQLFLAYESSLDNRRRAYCLNLIEALLKDALLAAQNDSPGQITSHSSLMQPLQLALEKHPEYPPFGLLMADAMAQSNELEEALYQVQLIPWSEAYQAQVDAKLEQLQAEITRRENSRDGIPLVRNDHHFVVHALAGQNQVLRLLVDTGASVTALTPSAIAGLQEHTAVEATGQRVQVHTANGLTESSVFRIATLQIGDRVQHNVQVLEVNLTQGGVDGLLGMNFLGHYAFSLDQQQARLYLTDTHGKDNVTDR